MKRLSSGAAHCLLLLVVLLLTGCTPASNETVVNDELESKEKVMTDDTEKPDGAAALKVLERTVSIG
ncbi:MAG: hypothetical protein O7G86_10735, partial [Gammaproteobacteria bacterium]|nr:hypothetical protein [Gammaproteobacteria bacterium]